MPMSTVPPRETAAREPAPAAGAPGAGRARSRALLLAPCLVAVLFSLLQVAGYSGMNYSNDSYRYARGALQILGHSRADAQAESVKAYCANRTARGQQTLDLDPATYGRPSQRQEQYQACVQQLPNGLSPSSPRFDRIFDTRPGYPLVVAPAVALLGVLPGMWVTNLLITLAGSLLALFLLRAIGASPAAALGGQIFYLASPITYWSMRPLSEGLVSVCALGAVLGAWWVVNGRLRAGVATLVGSFAVLSLTKYSTAMMLAAGFTAAGLALIVLHRRRSRNVLLFAVISLGVTAANAAAIALWSLPGTAETLQDTFTDHFDGPAVSDPWHRLLELNLRYWPHWVVTQALNPLFLACTALAGWALVRRTAPVVGWLCLAMTLVGLASAAAHPVASEVERLWLLAWIPPVLGTVLWVDGLRRTAKEPPTAAVSPTAG
ncbi:hypothetical protein ACIQGZ_13275 [Streptomyces sp. NPDC092296]|uniref:hypothetical protein n=1 Tax=Streptomyces sp. NPDC092296 TaxID=3366012 RepID=UPI00380B5869